MSCHNVGLALNSVVEVVIRLYDEGKLQLDSTREIIYSCRKAVNFCDGNEYEALESIYNNRCGLCLCKVTKGDLLFDLNDFWRLSFIKNDNDNLPVTEDILDNGEFTLTSHKLCKDCFVKVVNLYYKNENAGEDMVNYFISHLDKDDYTSTGE